MLHIEIHLFNKILYHKKHNKKPESNLINFIPVRYEQLIAISLHLPLILSVLVNSILRKICLIQLHGTCTSPFIKEAISQVHQPIIDPIPKHHLEKVIPLIDLSIATDHLKGSQIRHCNLEIVVADLVADLNKKVFIGQNLVNVKIKDDAIFNERSNQGKYFQLAPGLMHNVHTKSRHELHLLGNCDHIHRSH